MKFSRSSNVPLGQPSSTDCSEFYMEAEATQFELADKGTSLAQLRLGAQAQAPSTYRYPASFFDRVMSRLDAHDERRIIDAPLATEVVQ